MGDIWSRLSRLVPPPTASRLYWWSVLWKRLSIFSATETKEKENNLTANSISVNRTWEVNIWARLGWVNPCPHTRLEMLAGAQIGMNLRIWSVLLLGTCSLVRTGSLPGLFYSLLLSSGSPEANVTLCSWLAGWRLIQWSSAPSSVKRWPHRAAVGSEEDSEHKGLSTATALNKGSTQCQDLHP